MKNSRVARDKNKELIREGSDGPVETGEPAVLEATQQKTRYCKITNQSLVNN